MVLSEPMKFHGHSIRLRMAWISHAQRCETALRSFWKFIAAAASTANIRNRKCMRAVTNGSPGV